jgi:hypothetical protein
VDEAGDEAGHLPRLRAALAVAEGAGAGVGAGTAPPAVLPPRDDRVGGDVLPADAALAALAARVGATPACLRSLLERWLPALRDAAAAAAACDDDGDDGDDSGTGEPPLPPSSQAHLRARLAVLAAGDAPGALLAPAGPALRRSALRRALAGLLSGAHCARGGGGAAAAAVSLAAVDAQLLRLRAEAASRALRMLCVLVRAGGGGAAAAQALAALCLRRLAHAARRGGHAAADVVEPAAWLSLLVTLADGGSGGGSGGGGEAAVEDLFDRFCSLAREPRPPRADAAVRALALRAAAHVAAQRAQQPPATTLGQALGLEAGHAAALAALAPLWPALCDLEAAAAGGGGGGVIERLLRAPLEAWRVEPGAGGCGSDAADEAPAPLTVSAAELLGVLLAAGVVDDGPLLLLLPAAAPAPAP